MLTKDRVQGRLVVFGSYRLGVHSKSADIDVFVRPVVSSSHMLLSHDETHGSPARTQMGAASLVEIASSVIQSQAETTQKHEGTCVPMPTKKNGVKGPLA